MLYFETVTGTISPADQESIRHELADNESFRVIWTKLMEEAEAMHLGAFQRRLDEKKALLQFKERIRLQDHQGLADHAPAGSRKEDDYFDVDLNNQVLDIKEKTNTGSAATSGMTLTSPRGNKRPPSMELPPVLMAGDVGETPEGQSATVIVDQEDEERYTPVSRRYVGWRLAAAVILLLGLALAWLWPYWQTTLTNKTEIATLINKDKKEIKLQMASGKTVAIVTDKTDTVVKVGNGTIAFNTDNLTFKAADTALNLLEIPGGRFYNVTLSDGTKVALNAATKLRFPFHFKGATREVYLEGEAYFSVAKDAAHPFIVHTPLTRIRVLGTKFNVNTYQNGKVSTALVEGNVMTKANDNQATELALLPGKEALYENGSGFKVTHFDAHNVLSWMDGVYYFHNMPMSELAKEISRYFGVQVIIDNGIQNRSVTGMMDRSNLPELLSDLSEIAGIHYYYSDKLLHLQ